MTRAIAALESDHPDSAPPGLYIRKPPDDSDGDLTHAPNRSRPIHRADFGGSPIPTRSL